MSKIMEVPLTQGGKALVSEEDYKRVIEFDWFLDRGGRAYSDYAKSDGPGKSTYLHRFILQPVYPNIVHHINRDGLNNTRENLKILSYSANTRMKTFTRHRGPFRGVYCHYNKFVAEVTLNRRKYYLGIFVTAEQAALAYNRAVLAMCGEGFPLNEI